MRRSTAPWYKRPRARLAQSVSPGAFSFGLDVTVMTGIWATMTVAIAKESGHEVNKTYATKIAAAVLTGVASYVTGSKIAMKALHVVPLAGTLAAMGVNSFLNYWFTFKVGKALAELFDTSDFSSSSQEQLIRRILSAVSPWPTFDDLQDATDLLTETSFDKPETFKMFEEYRRQ